MRSDVTGSGADLSLFFIMECFVYDHKIWVPCALVYRGGHLYMLKLKSLKLYFYGRVYVSVYILEVLLAYVFNPFPLTIVFQGYRSQTNTHLFNQNLLDLSQ